MSSTHTFDTGRRSAAALAALSLAGVLLLTGCGAAGSGKSGASSDKAAVAPAARGEGAPGGGAAAGQAPAAGPAATDAKDAGRQPAAVRPNVIRTGTLSIETAEPQKVLTAARTAADGAGGYVGNESTQRAADGRLTSTLTLRVPGERFDAVIGALEGSGKLLGRKVEAQDVTQKVADVDSRVASQRASVARVREMMDKASALSDVVMLEGELSRRQSDLESLIAQQTALKDQTSLGTITVSVSEPAAVERRTEEKGDPSFGDALSGGWSVFTTVVRYLALAVAVVLPFAATAAAALFGFRLYRRLRPAPAKPGRVPAQVPRRPVSAGTGGPASDGAVADPEG
ncbi:DUF4349 domain-containing protein [Streptomyces sp. NPDC059104]|uniref:DUF4349 domain-containing protein n=1 Tax=Streptomyces sp. NPDC059104 TaxID=3346729 RepID=UPI0036D11C8D